MNDRDLQQLWSKFVECHQDNRISIGDAYRLKYLLSQLRVLNSVTLRRDGDTAVVEIEVGGCKTPIIREHIEGNFHHTVTAEGILEAFAPEPARSGSRRIKGVPKRRNDTKAGSTAMKPLILACLLLASCRHQVQPLKGAIAQVDAFQLTCAAGLNCDGGTPRRSFITSHAPTSEITVTRNGLTLYAGPDGFDYSIAPAHDGLVTVTMTSQPVVDGDLILLRYLTSAAERK